MIESDAEYYARKDREIRAEAAAFWANEPDVAAPTPEEMEANRLANAKAASSTAARRKEEDAVATKRWNANKDRYDATSGESGRRH